LTGCIGRLIAICTAARTRELTESTVRPVMLLSRNWKAGGLSLQAISVMPLRKREFNHLKNRRNSFFLAIKYNTFPESLDCRTRGTKKETFLSPNHLQI